MHGWNGTQPGFASERVVFAEIDALFHGMLEDRQSEEEVRSRSSHRRLGPLVPCEHLEYPVSTLI